MRLPELFSLAFLFLTGLTVLLFPEAPYIAAGTGCGEEPVCVTIAGRHGVTPGSFGCISTWEHWLASLMKQLNSFRDGDPRSSLSQTITQEGAQHQWEGLCPVLAGCKSIEVCSLSDMFLCWGELCLQPALHLILSVHEAVHSWPFSAAVLVFADGKSHLCNQQALTSKLIAEKSYFRHKILWLPFIDL